MDYDDEQLDSLTTVCLDPTEPTLPEHRLLIHVIYRAVLDLRGVADAEDREGAIEWFDEPWLESHGAERYGTFQYACEHLCHSDPQALGRKILKHFGLRCHL